MADDNFRNIADNFLDEGGTISDLLDYFGVKKSTYYSWRSRGFPASRTEELERFFEDDDTLEWGESLDLTVFLRGIIQRGENFLNVPANLLPAVFTERGHLWFTGVAHYRWIGGPNDGKELDEIVSRTTTNYFNYPSEGVPYLQGQIDAIFEPRTIRTKRGNYQVVVDRIVTDNSVNFGNADNDPFGYSGVLIWNTKYTDINVAKGRGEDHEDVTKIKGRKTWE